MTNDFFKQLMKLTNSKEYRELIGKIYDWSNNNIFSGPIIKNRKKFFRGFVVYWIYGINTDGSMEEIKEKLGSNFTAKDRKKLQDWYWKLDL